MDGAEERQDDGGIGDQCELHPQAPARRCHGSHDRMREHKERHQAEVAEQRGDALFDDGRHSRSG